MCVYLQSKMKEMKKRIFIGFGCEVIEKLNKIIVRYDSGGSASQMMENEITSEEVEKIKLSEQDAYEVILNARKRDNNKKL